MKAIFLDRDGVINRKAPDGEYIATWQHLEILPGVLESAAALKDAGYLIFVVTNQRGVATGKIDPADLTEIHANLLQAFENADARLSGIYCCTHDLDAGCACRKPKPGMLLQAACEHDLDLAECWMIGDSSSDMDAGIAAGCKTAWVHAAGSYEALEVKTNAKADIHADSLRTAVAEILKEFH